MLFDVFPVLPLSLHLCGPHFSLFECHVICTYFKVFSFITLISFPNSNIQTLYVCVCVNIELQTLILSLGILMITKVLSNSIVLSARLLSIKRGFLCVIFLLQGLRFSLLETTELGRNSVKVAFSSPQLPAPVMWISGVVNLRLVPLPKPFHRVDPNHSSFCASTLR